MVSLRKNKIITVMFLFVIQLVFLPEVNSYHPVDDYAVNCGSSKTITIYDGRTWVGDINTQLFSIIGPSLEANSPPHYPSTSNYPFSSARLSQSKFTYSFPVSNGPKFLRLHFYPTTYLNFEPNNALFSVTVGNFTLLKDFKPSLWVNRDDDDDENTISKEFIINVETGESRLNVTFIPSTITHESENSAYAFINGIEVVSMPSFLYYTDPNLSGSGDEFKVVGQRTRYELYNHKALETLYRVNVGGGQVPPNNDTGMFRNWEADYISNGHLEKEYPWSISSGHGYELQLNYKDNSVPNYTAPAIVYLTARNYGMDATGNYNVTWTFEVDSQFDYMVRLHFCEFTEEIKRPSDRVFQIFIAETMAEEYADVIVWSGDILVPVHRDYAVLNLPSEVKGTSSVKTNISIKLQPLPYRTQTAYHDVILNGIEVFKISDGNNNLAGPNPEPILSLSPPPQTHTSKKSKTTVVTIVAAVAVSGLILASAMGIIVFRRRRRRSHDAETTKHEGSTSLPSHLCRYFTIAEIRAATNDFDDVFIIGVGGFGNVYKGYIDGGFTPVAIKRLKSGSQQGVDEFLNEIEMLSQLRHVHLVSLIGYCNDGAEMILVYDFMQHGTLRECLYQSNNNNNHRPLTWKQRLEILLGAARGLHYLHAGVKHNIIHRDVKSTNILLDEKWVAKVSDFGLSKVGPTGTSMTHVSTVVKGSIGYLDPEYYKRQRLTLKSDVYSFGVVLLEVLCARPPLVRAQEKKKVSLVDWFRRCYETGGIYEIEKMVDPFLRDSIADECLKCYCHMTLSCLHDDGNQRPAMSDVVGALEFALQLVVVSEEDNMRFGGNQEDGKSEPMPRFMGDDHGSDGLLFTSSGDFGSGTSKVTTISASTDEEHPLVSATVFSEIGNPTAR